MSRFSPIFLAMGIFASSLSGGVASAAPPHGGFTTIIAPSLTGEEIGSQENLWALQVAVKPMRMILVQVTDPKTGAKSSELIWYLVYKISNQPVPQRVESTDVKPVNSADAPIRPILAPRATLVTEGRNGRRAIVDSIIPEAVQAISEREGMKLKDSVEIAGYLNDPKPNPTDADAYGVFTFRGVDPRTIDFSVYLLGFSSAYKKVMDPAGKTAYLRRTAKIPYRRLADEFDQYEREIRQSADPTWVYVPDEPSALVKS